MNRPPTSQDRCVLGDPDREHPAHVGMLCDHHLQRLTSDLREIEKLTIELSGRPAGTAYRSPAAGGGRGATLASQRSVLDLERDALVGRSAEAFDGLDPEGWDDTPHITDRVGTWARQLRSERGLAAAGGTLVEDRRLLVRHLDWIADRPWVVELATDVALMLTLLRRAAGTGRGDAGPCPRIVDGQPCSGRIRRARGTRPWLVRDDRCELVHLDDVPAGALHCPACGASWPTATDEARLRVMLADAARDALRPRTDDGRMMVTARELADRTGLSLRAVQLRLHRSEVTAVMDRGMGWYPPDAIAPRPAGGAASP